MPTAGRAAIIVAATLFVYAPIFHGGWLWDDSTAILHNSALQEPGGLGRIWSGAAGLDYFPLTTTVQWCEWRLWHADVEGYHLVNVALHLLSALLLWRILAKLAPSSVEAGAAWLGGLLFAIHPVAVESVAWISELKNTLALPPLLAAFAAWIDFDRRGRRRDWGGAWLGCSASLLAKTSGALFPAFLLLYAWWRRGRIGLRDLAASAPFFAIAFSLGLVTVHLQAARAMAHLALPAEGWVARLAAAGPAAWFYLLHGLFPFPLLPIYPRWTFAGPIPWRTAAWLGLGLGAAWTWHRRATWGRGVLWVLGAFGLSLLPILGLVPMAYLRIARVSDHFAYLALAALCGGVAAAAGHWRAAIRPAVFGGGWALVLAGALLASRRYAGHYTSEEALWRYTLARNPAAWLAENNLAIVLTQSGRAEEAVAHGEAAVRLQPAAAEARSNLGLALTEAHRLPEAVVQLEAAVRLRPDLAGARLNLGRALVLAGRETDALPELAAALRLAPADATIRHTLSVAHNNRANRLARAGQLPAAVDEYRQAIAVEPANPGPHRNLAYALHALGHEAEALTELDLSARLARSR
jgi:Flp pilus assembly protein TadD